MAQRDTQSGLKSRPPRLLTLQSVRPLRESELSAATRRKGPKRLEPAVALFARRHRAIRDRRATNDADTTPLADELNERRHD